LVLLERPQPWVLALLLARVQRLLHLASKNLSLNQKLRYVSVVWITDVFTSYGWFFRPRLRLHLHRRLRLLVKLRNMKRKKPRRRRRLLPRRLPRHLYMLRKNLRRLRHYHHRHPPVLPPQL
jgi:hypothetical protein